MTLFTRKGDDGKTGAFGCDQRMSKSSAIAEALGALDETNAYLGVCKVHTDAKDIKCNDIVLTASLNKIQNDLFVVQAEVAGADKTISKERVEWLEEIITDIESTLPEIKSFFIPGGTELAARLDFARTLVRWAERRVVAVHEEAKATTGRSPDQPEADLGGVQKVGTDTLAYLNRLSSVLYVFVRYVNHTEGAQEDSPDYK